MEHWRKWGPRPCHVAQTLREEMFGHIEVYTRQTSWEDFA